jgi:cytochrome c-type biogenesis protein CcmH/NrfG
MADGRPPVRYDWRHAIFGLSVVLMALAFGTGVAERLSDKDLRSLGVEPTTKADRLSSRGAWLQAIQQYRMATQVDPSDVRSWIRLGEILRKAQRYDEATLAYRGALSARPRSVEPVLGLGELALDQSLYGEAIARFSLAVALDPRNVEAQNGLGIAYASSGAIDEAIPHFELAAALSPDPSIRGNLERARLERAQGTVSRTARP